MRSLLVSGRLSRRRSAFWLAMGFGPRTELNDIYHRLMLLLLIVGLILLLTPIARSSLGRRRPAV